ncbi:hypothetical protein NAEGRDRAFT_80900 [Naegleria gruberi]|uniref:Uncharacterized protein n=1 Tax=Naegleria gruberi TaxID=5762 RepID=D2VQT1_NAEGR|nr:uncharacterized protein NAEGRDRAFT_80900 [Naegleria gruberi]EFC40763.1 hypothetical protein NAEGRDRAFT_80900 [Naegleria gruberi]|eukprot:XP_002673507.1 hypothetical protein NAEGRDRAFT_80900 [Naegleria gruberi strain NEG-M]
MKKILKERQQTSPLTPTSVTTTNSTNFGGATSTISISSNNSGVTNSLLGLAAFGHQQQHQLASATSLPLESSFFNITSPSTLQSTLFQSSPTFSTPTQQQHQQQQQIVYNNQMSYQQARTSVAASDPTLFINSQQQQNMNQQGPLPSLFNMNPQQQANSQNYPSLSTPNFSLPSLSSSAYPQLSTNSNNNGSISMNGSSEKQQAMVLQSMGETIPSFSIPTTVLNSSSNHHHHSMSHYPTTAATNTTKHSTSSSNLQDDHYQSHGHIPRTASSSAVTSSPQVEKPVAVKASGVATADQPIVEYMDDDDGWIAQWFNEDKRQKWKLKKEVGNMIREENVMAHIDLNYEDGQKVLSQKSKDGKKKKKKKQDEEDEDDKKNDEPVITNNESFFNYQSTSKSTVTIGPFMYNICSYKQEGKKFRMVVYLYTLNNSTPYHPFQQQQPLDLTSANSNAVLCCCLISPSFTIRAKKPIVKPGIKSKRKRGVDEDDSGEDEMEGEPSPTNHKRMKEPLNEDAIPNYHHIARSNNGSTIEVAPHQNQAATQAIDELLESLYKNNGGFVDPSLLGTAPSTSGSSSAASSSSQHPVNTEEKIKNITETFQNMADPDRKKLLCNFIELCYPHEREFLFRKYFESSDYGESSNYNYSAQQSNHLQTMLQQYQMIQQQQQDLYAYFTALNGGVVNSQPNDHGMQMVQLNVPSQIPQVLIAQSSIPQHQIPPQQSQQSIPQQHQPQPINPSQLSFAANHQPSDVDQFFVELFD